MNTALRFIGWPAALETVDKLLRQRRDCAALVVIDALIKQQPEDQDYIRLRGILLADMGDVLLAQGQYEQALEVYVEKLRIAIQQGDVRAQVIVQMRLGTLAFEQRKYVEARSHYLAALKHVQTLSEPPLEVVVWHQLGRVAEMQKEWTEAERNYRRSLALEERLGDKASAVKTCNQLRYPCYWHYDILFGLKVMAEAGFIGDPRCHEALRLLAAKRLPDGGFPAEKKHYSVTEGNGRSLVDWGGTGAKRMNPIVTTDALYVLKRAPKVF